MSRFVFGFVLVAGAFTLSKASAQFESESVVSLTDKTFAESTSNGKVWFVKFFAPWCGHCKKLAPTWAELGAKFKSNENVVIAHIDCTHHKETCNTQEIKGYPTLKAFFPGVEPRKYKGGRDVDTLSNYVEDLHSEFFAETTT